MSSLDWLEQDDFSFCSDGAFSVFEEFFWAKFFPLFERRSEDEALQFLWRLFPDVPVMS